jgi:hypothetical protein
VRARVAWVLAGITLLLVVADAAVTAQYRHLLSEAAVAVHGFPFVNGAVLGCAAMGALIISRYDRHPIGWLLSVVGTTSAVSLLAEAYGVWVVSEGGPGTRSLGGVAGWVSTLLGGQLAIAGLAFMFLLAPDGHLLSPRWRVVAWVTAVGELLCVVAIVSTDPTTYDLESQEIGTVRRILFSGGFLLISVGMLGSLGSMLRRLRTSRGEQRQQVRLIALGAAGVSFGLACLFVVQLFNGGQQTWAASLPLFVSYLLLPLLFATAVLRYRLYDIEVIINRAVVLAVGTAFAAVGYTTLVVAVGKLVGRQTGGFWLSLLAIALVAVAFQPLRRGVVRLANRLAYGSRAQPYEALSDFSSRLAETPSPDTLLPAVADAAGRAVSARGAKATLDLPGAGAASAIWGSVSSEGTDTHVVPVRERSLTLGSIEVNVPKGRGLRASDQRLLEALADHSAIAFRNTALEARLAGRVAELDRTTQELARSRLRIIEADDAARRTLEAAISRQVLPHLAALPDELHRLREAVELGAPANGIDRLIAGTNTALESLRDLTRGVFPTQLARAGLEPALRSMLARESPATTLRIGDTANGRVSARVEAAVYFCCAETARGCGGVSSIELSVVADDLVLRITGVDGSAVDVQAVVDRVEAVGGVLSTDDDTWEWTIPSGTGRPTT